MSTWEGAALGQRTDVKLYALPPALPTPALSSQTWLATFTSLQAGILHHFFPPLLQLLSPAHACPWATVTSLQPNIKSRNCFCPPKATPLLGTWVRGPCPQTQESKPHLDSSAP